MGLSFRQLRGTLLLMFDLILFEPEIPPNTGNVMRLCANAGASLHLVHPLVFQMQERSLRRAGLDYRERATVAEYDSLDECLRMLEPRRLFALSTKGSKSFFAEIFYR